MSFYPSMKDPAYLDALFLKFSRGVAPLIELHDAVLRNDDSALSFAERETIAALVSGLNACVFCYGSHTAIAADFGVDEHVITALVADIDTAPVDEKLKPLLRYVHKLTLTPSKMVQADADAVFAAGWPEEALNDAVVVCALYNFMNRILDGSGIKSRPPVKPGNAASVASQKGGTYSEWARAKGIIE